MEPIQYLNSTNYFAENALAESPYGVVFWIFILFNVIAIALAKIVGSNYFKSLFYTSLFNRYLLQNSQEDLKLRSFGSVILSLSYINSIALVATIVLGQAFGKTTFIFIGAFLSLILIKGLLMRSVTLISMIRNGVEEHFLNHLVYFQIGSILITAVLLFAPLIGPEFQSAYQVLLIAIIGLLILVRDFQSLIRSIQSRISIFYIILYLCTLELLPLVLIIYTLVSKFEEFN